MRPLKRQWRDGAGVVHEALGTGKLNYAKVTRMKCWRQTPTLWHPTRDPPTCLECICYVPKMVSLQPLK